ncbi:SRPBCC domain-containing protein [Nigerium massiliense]|uniref:SRPBCC domain-containing protein n=1 Tax=Nigerium massiliense TaxID=1522317 RepID=UPI000693BFD6|nr:SRPBCC domain-containing protein [Nigerium massiliense]
MPIVNSAVDADGCRVRWRFGAPADLVWDGLTDRVWLRRWLGAVVSGEVALGETVVIDHGDGQRSESRVLTAEPGSALELTWSFPDEPMSRVEVTLDAEGEGGTTLTLTHRGLGELASGYRVGWHVHLLYLSAALRASPMALDRFWEVHEKVARAYP